MLFPALSEAQQLRILTTEEPPANYLKKGRITGFSADIVREIASRLRLKTEVEMMPWARAYFIAKTRPNVVAFTAGRTSERLELGFHFLGPVMSRKHIIWKHRIRNLPVTGLKAALADDYLISGMRGDWRTKYFLDRNARVLATNNNQQGLRQLLLNRTDLWISSDIEARTITREIGIDLARLEPAFLLKEAPSYIMISKATSPEILRNWQQAFESLEEADFYDRLVRKWSRILGYPLHFTPEKGIHILSEDD